MGDEEEEVEVVAETTAATNHGSHCTLNKVATSKSLVSVAIESS